MNWQHATAIVEAGATIGDDTRIWHHSHVRSGATIGGGYIARQERVRRRRRHDRRPRQDPEQRQRLPRGDDRRRRVPRAVVRVHQRSLPASGRRTGRSSPPRSHTGASVGANATIVCGITLGRVVGGRLRAPSSPTTCAPTSSSSATRPGPPAGCASAAGSCRASRDAPPCLIRVCASCQAELRVIPITSRRVGAEEEALVLEVLRSGMLAQGRWSQRFEAACCEMTRRPQHAVAVNNGTTALVVASRGARFAARRRGGHQPVHVRRHAQRDPRGGRDRSLRRHSRRPTSTSTRGRSTSSSPTAPRCCCRCTSTVKRLTWRHPHRWPPADRVGHSSRTPPRPTAPRTTAGPIGTYGQRHVQLLRHQEPRCAVRVASSPPTTTSLADRLRLLRNHGMRARYQYELPGHNYRLTDLAAAVAIPPVRPPPGDHCGSHARTPPTSTTTSSAVAGRRHTGHAAEGRSHAWHQYTLRITAECPVGRDDRASPRLNDAGIGAGVYYPSAVYDYDCYRTHPRVHIDGGSPVAERVAT